MEEKELECPICTQFIFKPISLYCGHSFCKDCLKQALENRPACPVCRNPSFLNVSELKENILLKNIVESKYPDYYKERHLEASNSFSEIKSVNKIDEIVNFNGKLIIEKTSSSEIYFPFLQYQSTIILTFPLEKLSEICPDQTFIAYDKKSKFYSPLIKVTHSKPISETEATIKFRVIRLCKINSIQQITSEQGLSFFSAKGEYIVDEFPNKENFNMETTRETITHLGKIIQKKLRELEKVSFNTYQMLVHKVGENNISIFNPSSIQTTSDISKFSLIGCGILHIEYNKLATLQAITNPIQRLSFINEAIISFEPDCLPMKFFNIQGSTSTKGHFLMYLALAFCLLIYSAQFSK